MLPKLTYSDAALSKTAANNTAVGYLGSYTALCFACVAFLTSTLLPVITSHGDGLLQFEEEKPRGTHLTTLLTVWSVSLALSAVLLFSTGFVSDFSGATVLIAANGISWTITNWLPFVLIGQTLNEDVAGSITGLHNVAISAPQVLAAGICGLIFWIAGASDSGVGWVLWAGGLAHLAASGLAGWTVVVDRKARYNAHYTALR